uniref:uncharacterized protein n=1 Tax=Pristiophorus japonicus TaxID=55135 RepID=UPI00398F276C
MFSCNFYIIIIGNPSKSRKTCFHSQVSSQDVEFLGRRIAAVGIRPTNAKTEAIKNAPRPRNVTELRSFLGLLNYFDMVPNGSLTQSQPKRRVGCFRSN